MAEDDPRVRRTRTRLRSAVRELAATRDPDSITVAEIAQRAEVNRATVYVHYRDRDDLVLDAMETAVGELAADAARCPYREPGPVPAALVALFGHVGARAPLYRRMLGPYGSARFCARLREALVAGLRVPFGAGSRPPGHDDVPPEIHAHHVAGALIGVITYWLEEQPPRPAGEIAAAAWSLIGSGR
ncbi:AcrR family transcriptional regulator [Streptosporangium becharense]|uniref:AcrR family transcriptional regulator n=1 Tax=Streptosporangium becharense TaxID=1816182 RepID=A0A7W9IFV4_9ACTN|nr:TetR/AcrR family transcriptional regulator [Streptosporangium becharense]MBB2909241.1 AcrR family transcriptional regulator [Streptosporangium becharense]MBB5819740.1 AcrR family transcriptional regulator [Streptosporangium becharense]